MSTQIKLEYLETQSYDRQGGAITLRGIKLNYQEYLKKVDDEPRRLIVYTHGTKVFLPNKLNFFSRLSQQLRCDIVCFAYRGFSHSDPGYPSEEAVIRDCQAIADFTLKHLNEQQGPDNNIDVILYGKSFGGCTCLKVAQLLPKGLAKAIILESAFTNIGSVLQFLIPTCGLGKLLSKVTSLRYANDEAIQNIEVPILFATGNRDRIVPHIMSHRLFQLATKSAKKELIEVEGAGHNRLYVADKDLWKKYDSFITECCKIK